MIRVTFTESGKKLSLRLEGHAGYAEAGQDIVCASASILAYTVAQEIKHMESHGRFAEPPTIDLAEGDATIVCVAKDIKTYEEMLHKFSIIKLGYELLAHNYPQYVEFIDDKA